MTEKLRKPMKIKCKLRGQVIFSAQNNL